MFEGAKKPLLIFGWGIHSSGTEKEAIEFARKLNVPVVCTWAAADLFHHDDPLYIGVFGTHGVRAANFAIQNADVIVSVGSRLDTKATGTPASDFAPKAKVFMVEIDEAEINKFKKLGREVAGIHKGAMSFFIQNTPREQQPEYQEWLEKIHGWKRDYPSGMETEGLDPYKFMEELSDLLKPEDTIVTDTGCSLGWLVQAFKFKGQRLIHAFNQTPMGYGLPGAIGAAFATGGRVILITGDGGLGLCAAELATLHRHSLTIKIVLFNNRGHAMCRQTQRTWLGGEYPSTSHEGGLATPDWNAVAAGYGIRVANGIEGLLDDIDGPAFLNLDIPYDCQIVPQVRFGRPLHDADPFLSREELERIMA